MQLTAKQEAGLKMAVTRADLGMRYTVIAGYAGSGKAQPNDTIIPTLNGFKRLDELKIGDYIFDRLGQPTKVIGIFPQGKLEVFKVTFKDGRSTLCNDEHLWAYYNQKGNDLFVASLKELQARGLTYNSGSYKIKIPRCKPLQYPEKQFKIDPYVIGCFLGDGYCTSNELAFSSSDEEIVQEIALKIGAKNYVRKAENEYTWFFESFNPKGRAKKYIQTYELFDNELKDYLIQYSDKKRIPPEYLQGSIKQRYELLRGLLDTDGSINATDKYHQIRFTTISENLCKDFMSLL